MSTCKCKTPCAPLLSTLTDKRYDEIVAFVTDYRPILPDNKRAEAALLDLVEEVAALRVERQALAAEINAIVSKYEKALKAKEVK